MKTNFENVEEAINDLKTIDKCDLSAKDVDENEARYFLIHVMCNVLKCENLKFSEEQMNLYSNTLKEIGCKKWDDCNPELIKTAGETVKEIMLEKNSAFAISVLSQLIDTKKETFDYGLNKATEGGIESSWVAKWIKTQYTKDSKNEFVQEF